MKKPSKPQKKVAAKTEGNADDRMDPSALLEIFRGQGASPYELLDTGRGRKLENVGGHRFNRQCPVAFWEPRRPSAEWKNVDAEHRRTETGGGFWENRKTLPPFWFTKVGRLVFKTKMTAFGHLGFFAEQAEQWDWFYESLVKRVPAGVPDEQRPRILNLFAYTGGSSLACALGGAHVTHVDAAKGVVDWARQNAAINGVPEGRLRFAVEDCIVFLEREAKRGNRYDGFIMDPPSYGRGPNKEIFKLEDDIQKLLGAAARILKPEPVLVHFSCHTPGFTPIVLGELLADAIPYVRERKERIQHGEMLVRSVDGKPVPSGFFARFT